jgi:hypothetical protein
MCGCGLDTPLHRISCRWLYQRWGTWFIKHIHSHHSLTLHFLTHASIHPSIHSLLYSSSNNSTELLCMFHVRAGIPSACVRTGPTRKKEKKKKRQ